MHFSRSCYVHNWKSCLFLYASSKINWRNYPESFVNRWSSFEMMNAIRLRKRKFLFPPVACSVGRPKRNPFGNVVDTLIIYKSNWSDNTESMTFNLIFTFLFLLIWSAKFQRRNDSFRSISILSRVVSYNFFFFSSEILDAFETNQFE